MNTSTMSLEDAVKKAAEIMLNAAKHEGLDKKAPAYTADMHARHAGYAMRVVLFPKDAGAAKLEGTSSNIAALFHALYNHSAWRQKFEKAEIFPKAKAKTFAGAMDELEEEFGE